MASAARLPLAPVPEVDEAAGAYDAVGDTYRVYADGDCQKLFNLSGRFGFASREISQRIEAVLIGLRARGRWRIRIPTVSTRAEPHGASA